MNSLATEFQDMLLQTGLIPPGARCLAAISGGSDSTALLLLLSEAAPKLNLSLTAAHVNHNLRPQARADADFAAGLCARLGIPLRILSADVRQTAKNLKISLEEAGRWERYNFFLRLRSELKLDLIVTAHTADDQAETVLMRLINGAGTAGLAGIRSCRGSLVRPLLSYSKTELREYLRSRGQEWREDHTNHIPSAPRTAVRLNILPEMKKLNPAAVKAIVRLAASAREDEDYFQAEAEKFRLRFQNTARDGSAAEASFPRRELRELPVQVRKRFWALLFRQAGEGENGDFSLGGSLESCHYAALEDFLRLDNEKRLCLPGGIRAVWRRDRLLFKKLEPAPERPRRRAEEISFSAGDLDELLNSRGIRSFDVPAFGCRLAFKSEDVSFRPSRLSVCLDPLRLRKLLEEGQRLSLRSRREGDTIFPAGGIGRQKLKKYLQSEKVLREHRDELPLLCCGNAVIWPLGLRADQGFLAKPGQRDVISVNAEMTGPVPTGADSP